MHKADGVRKLGTAAKQAGNRGKGRPKGSVNKTTAAAKEAFILAAEGIGGVDALTDWGRENPDKFWPLYAKLIPTDITSGGQAILLTAAERDARVAAILAAIKG